MTPIDKACENLARNLGSNMRTMEGYGVLSTYNQKRLASDLLILADELKKEILEERGQGKVEVDRKTFEYALRRHNYSAEWAATHFQAVDKGVIWARQHMGARLRCGCLFEEVFGEPYRDDKKPAV